MAEAETPTHEALAIKGVKSASFRRHDDHWVGVVYDTVTGIEYDVRELDDGWSVNDDFGRDFKGTTIRDAFAIARPANRRVAEASFRMIDKRLTLAQRKSLGQLDTHYGIEYYVVNADRTVFVQIHGCDVAFVIDRLGTVRDPDDKSLDKRLLLAGL